MATTITREYTPHVFKYNSSFSGQMCYMIIYTGASDGNIASAENMKNKLHEVLNDIKKIANSEHINRYMLFFSMMCGNLESFAQEIGGLYWIPNEIFYVILSPFAENHYQQIETAQNFLPLKNEKLYKNELIKVGDSSQSSKSAAIQTKKMIIPNKENTTIVNIDNYCSDIHNFIMNVENDIVTKYCDVVQDTVDEFSNDNIYLNFSGATINWLHAKISPTLEFLTNRSFYLNIIQVPGEYGSFEAIPCFIYTFILILFLLKKILPAQKFDEYMAAKLEHETEFTKYIKQIYSYYENNSEQIEEITLAQTGGYNIYYKKYLKYKHKYMMLKGGKTTQIMNNPRNVNIDVMGLSGLKNQQKIEKVNISSNDVNFPVHKQIDMTSNEREITDYVNILNKRLIGIDSNKIQHLINMIDMGIINRFMIEKIIEAKYVTQVYDVLEEIFIVQPSYYTDDKLIEFMRSINMSMPQMMAILAALRCGYATNKFIQTQTDNYEMLSKKIQELGYNLY